MNVKKSRPASASGVRSTRPKSTVIGQRQSNSQSAQANYERLMTLAHAEALRGDRHDAETHYQYAEYYLRSMSENADERKRETAR